jgi:hypothetical protein
LTHQVRDSPSSDFIHGLHGKVFSAKAIVLECDGTRAHFDGNKRRIESILLNGGKQRPDCGRIAKRAVAGPQVDCVGTDAGRMIGIDYFAATARQYDGSIIVNRHWGRAFRFRHLGGDEC